MTDAEYKTVWATGYKARVEFGSTICPYLAAKLAEAWWDGYERAMEDEGVFAD